MPQKRRPLAVEGKRRPRPAAGGFEPAVPQKHGAELTVFLTWSGERSKQVALALRQSLRIACNAFKPWMSDVDIAAGARWQEEIAAQLDQARAAHSVTS